MKKLLSILVIGLLALSLMPGVFADEASTGGGVTVGVDDPNDAPVIYTDSTERSWYPNDQTYYTAEEYASGSGDNSYCDFYYDVGIRGDYVFGGETVTYYVVVEDTDGEDDIEDVVLLDDNTGNQIGTCGEILETDCGGIANGTDLSAAGFDQAGLFMDDATMNLYRCRYIVPTNVQDTRVDPTVQATDSTGQMATTAWADSLVVNPPLTVTLTGGIDFGSSEAGTTVTSNTVQLQNVGSNGVVMDMYIASDDWFTDPTGAGSCGAFGNGIPFTSFSYYASKGSVDSGDNDNNYPALGETGTWEDTENPPNTYDCLADADEYTPVPSHSGDIQDMCRIINHQIDSSGLTQGQSMNLRFQLDIPNECSGSFTQGQFHFVGRVV